MITFLILFFGISWMIKMINCKSFKLKTVGTSCLLLGLVFFLQSNVSAQVFDDMTVKVLVYANGGKFEDGSVIKVVTKNFRGIVEHGTGNRTCIKVPSDYPVWEGYDFENYILRLNFQRADIDTNTRYFTDYIGNIKPGDEEEIVLPYGTKYMEATLFACWEPKKYVIECFSQGKRFEIYYIYYKDDWKFNRSPDRPGYHFLGWDTSSNAKNVVYKLGSIYTSHKSVNLYAVWKDDIAPDIKNVKVTSDTNGYTVTCDVSDAGSGFNRVQFPTWTDKNGQDDLLSGWQTSTAARGTVENGKATFRVNRSDHNNEYGKYHTHIYCYDNDGNYSVYRIDTMIETDPPIIKNVKISNDPDGYTITCEVSDEGSGIDRVQFPTWSDKDGQDDLLAGWKTASAARGTIKDGIATFRVNRSDHNNEMGIYFTHIYAFDKCQNSTVYKKAILVDGIAPEIFNVKVAADMDGYTITCEVSDEISGIDRVQFPTWTEKDGQDDLVSGWQKATAASGILNGGNVTFRVNRTDHNNEMGEYITHIWLFRHDGG